MKPNNKKPTKVRCAVVGNRAYEPLVEGNLYLVCRRHDELGDPVYSLCTYRNGNWVPYGLEDYILNMSEFTGIPVLDEDYWVCANTAFEGIYEEQDASDTQEPKDETVQEYVERRRMEIDNEEKEALHKTMENDLLLEMEGKRTPNGMHITPSHTDMAIGRTNKTIRILMEYIQGMKDAMIDSPMIEKNWEHFKNFTNGLLDRIIDLERRVDNMPITLPYGPNTPLAPLVPASPNIPSVPPSVPGWPGSVPGWPGWPPFVTCTTGTPVSGTLKD